MNKCKKVTKQHRENYPIQMYGMEIRSPPPKLGVIIADKKKRNNNLILKGNIKLGTSYIFR